MSLVRDPRLVISRVWAVPWATTRRPVRLLGAILALVCLGGLTGCVTRFHTGASLGRDHQRLVAGDLAIGGVLTRRPGEAGARLPEATARFASITGAEDRSATLSDQDLEVLLASPSEMREAVAQLHSLSNRIGHRYVLVGEASTAPTDVQRSWIIQVILPIPFLWISFGIPVQYASYPDLPHSTVSARVIDLERGEILAASFEVRSGIDPGETPGFRNAAAGRAVRRMALEEP
jgi:hypothetical protein